MLLREDLYELVVAVAADDGDLASLFELTNRLHDAHLHLMSIGRTKERVDLRGVRSPQALRAKVAAFAAKHPTASVITGRGWDQSRWPSRRFPTWRDLEGETYCNVSDGRTREGPAEAGPHNAETET